MPAHDVTITWTWNINNYTVTYAYDGNVPEWVTPHTPEQYDYSGTITQPSVTPVEWYTFWGWNDVPEKMPAHDVTITWTWNIHTHTITYYVDGEITGAVETYNYGSGITIREEPTKEWYTFSHWDRTLPPTMPDEDLVVSGHFTINQYTITFVLWNGEENIVITWDYNTWIIAPDEPTRSGHTFMWWDRTIPATMPAENLTITATWKAHEVFGPFRTSGGSAFKIALFSEWADAWKIDVKTTKAQNGGVSDFDLAVFLLGGDAPTTAEWIRALFDDTNAEIENISDLGWNVLFLKFPKWEWYSTKWFCSNQACSYFATSWSSEVTPEFKSEAMDTANVEWPSWSISANNYIKYNTVWESWYVVLVSDNNGTNWYVYVPIKKYTIIWKNGDDQTIETDQDVKYGTTPTYDGATPTKTATEQYTYTWNHIWSPEVVSVTWDATYTAQFDATVNKYTVTFDTDGWSEIVPVEVEYGSVVSRPVVDPEKTHYDFDNWYSNSTKTQLYDFTLPILTGITIYAKYTPHRYTITYDLAGWRETTRNITWYTIYLDSWSLVAPTRTWYTFSGWLGTDLTGVTKTVNIKALAEEYGYKDREYTAVWEAKKYTVNYYSDWTKVDTKQVAYDSVIPDPDQEVTEALVKTWYHFIQWWDRPATMPNETVRVDAVWSANNYTVEFLPWEWTGEMESQVFVYDADAQALNANEFSRIGYHFDKWLWSDSNYYNDEQSVRNLTSDENWVFTMTAQYEKNSYNFELITDAYLTTGWSSLNGSHLYEEEINIVVSPIAGYAVLWCSASGVDIVPSGTNTWTFNMPANDVTVTCMSYLEIYTIDYELNGGELTWWKTNPTSYTILSGDIVLNNPERTGYTFVGWTWSNGLTPQTEITIWSGSYGYKHYFAAWTPITYSIDYELNGGELTWWKTNPTSYTIESDDIVLNNPERTGYTFIWWTWSNGEDPQLNVIIVSWSIEDKSYNAAFTANEDTPYWVEYYYQLVDGQYPTTATSWDYGRTWTTDTKALVTLSDMIPTDSWYVFDSNNVNNVLSGNIAWDGNLLLKVYFKKQFTVRYLTWSKWTFEIQINSGLDYDVLTPAFVWNTWDHLPGYEFAGWSWEVAGRVTDNVDYTAQWNPISVEYTVEHYKQNIENDEYSIVSGDTQVLDGITESDTQAAAKTYEWFTAQAFEQQTIQWDGSTIVKIYYTRNLYNLIIKDRGEILVDTGIKFEDIIPLPDDPIWTWYEFSWWSNLPEDKKMPSTWLEISALWNVNTYTITFDTNGWTEIAPITQDYGTIIVKPANPEKYRYAFVSWEPEIPETMPAYDMTIKAIWEADGHSGKWRRWNKPDWEGEHGSADEESELYEQYPTVDHEVLSAYLWAKKYGITTMDTFEEADAYGLLLRWHMAKISVNYAVNVLWRQMPTEIPAKCSWWDDESERESEEIKDYARKSCALWIMGIYMEDFLPNKEVSRAEFWTILSRLLWWDIYNVIDTNETPFYVKHLSSLKKENIMTQIDRPLIRKELREWVWVMLRRASELY